MDTKTNYLNALKVLGVFATVAITGCGGGGSYNNDSGGGFPGGGTTNTYGTVLGRVVSVDGTVIPGASVTVDNSSVHATTLSQGGYELDGVPSGIQRITANANVNGISYTGSTQTLILDNTTVSNAGIQLSPSSKQATVTGTVTDASGRALADARVFLGVYATSPPPDGSGDVASLVAFTDSAGRYRINNIPTDITSYTIAASLLNYQNSFATVSNLSVGELRRLDFHLNFSNNQSVATPQNVAAQSFTQPSNSNSNIVSATTTTSAYEQIRRTLSPKYAQLHDAGHLAAKITKLRTFSTPNFTRSYVVESDVFFTEALSNAISGYRVYNSQGSNALQAYDFLQDPLASFYSDLSSFYAADQQYNFAVSAVNTDSQESQLSATASVVPLGLLTVSQPQAGQTVTNPVTFRWNTVNGASSYAVFVYNKFPSVGVQPLVTKTDIGAAVTSTTLSGTLTSADYWAVVAASADNDTEITVSQIIHFHVQ